MQHHHYQKPEDLFRAQAALMQWVRIAGHCSYLHKGDIGHRLFNSCYGYDPADMFHYWVDESGEICAFSILLPHKDLFDLQVAPRLYCSDAHVAFLDFCAREFLRLAEKYGTDFDHMNVEACEYDRAYISLVESRGFVRRKLTFVMTRHDLVDLPDAHLPAGFHFHDATIADAAALADVHNHSFTNKWNAESYSAVFNSPHMEREIVVVAPDGRCAAFINIWIDSVNRSLLFEPVGTHSDFRRRGIAKALMVYALRRMQAEAGITCAYVGHEPPVSNPASTALYASVGFKKLHGCYDFAKPAKLRAESA